MGRVGGCGFERCIEVIVRMKNKVGGWGVVRSVGVGVGDGSRGWASLIFQKRFPDAVST